MRNHPATVIPSSVARPPAAIGRKGLTRTAARDLLLSSRRVALYAIGIGLTALFSLSAQAQEPVPLARGNTPGEPHHHLKIENEYVRVYYVEVPPHENTQLHQHDHDYIYVSLGPSDVVNAILNTPEIHLQLKDGETHFTRGGFAHVARNLADTPFRNITIELLKPQGEAHNVCGTIIAVETVTMCEPAPGSVAAMTLFETAEVSLANVVLLPKGKHKEKDSKSAFLFIGVSGTGVKVNTKRKSPEVLHEGEAEWFEPKSEVGFSNESSKVTHFLQLAFKDSAAQPKP